MRIAAAVLRLLVVVPALLGLVACSGGGGGAPPPAPTYTVTGTIIAAGGSVADWDVNDPYAPHVEGNDSCATAQPLPNPVTLGGYLNAPGEGAPGRSFEAGDLDDFYRVSLQAGQTVTLFIGGDPAEHDLDLYLFSAACADLVAFSEGYGATEAVTAPSAGDYVIQVAVYCDGNDCGTTASNYTLVVGQSAQAGVLADTLDAGAEFVPGEVIVRFADSHQPLGLAAADQRIQALGLARKAGAPSRQMLLSLGEATGGAAALAALGVNKTPGQALARHGRELSPELQARLETVAAVRALRARPEVATADLNYIRRALAVTPNDPFYSYQWHYPQINLPAAWEVSKGTDVIVAVVDTGVLLAHPDFDGQLVAGYDFISDDANSGDDESGIDDNPDDPGDRIMPDGRSSFHGTHVAGTVAARTNNSVGVAGVAGGAKIMPLRVLGRFGGSSYDIQQAIRYAAGLANDSETVPSQPADIINLSLGGGGASTSEQEVYTLVRDQGVIIVAAAGNENSSTPSYPASYDGVISVSAVDINKQRAPYSNFGSKIDVAAPGGDLSRDLNGDGYGDGVLSTAGDDGSGTIKMGYNFQQGTSMAAPHVAGVLALMKAVNSDLTPNEVDVLLAEGALTEDLGAPGRDDLYGWGLIDALQAVQAAPQSDTPADTPAVLLANPTSLNFATSETSLNLQLRNGGTAALTGVAVTDSASWLEVTASSVDGEGLGTYTVTVNRDTLAEGSHSATITATSSANSVTIPVIMQVPEPQVDLNANTGFQWIVLVDPATLETVKTASADNKAGVYNFEFSGVPAGNYLIFAGSDANNDDIICDAGESCGSWPTLSAPVEVAVSGNVSGVNFVSSYGFNIGAAGLLPDRPGFSRTPVPSKQLERQP
ncbi:S8 family serine peptidase [Desulfurivibrio sp. D14AmB]|uniref:S8 family serine peptidase n=1 Tax=Desulfurivibrio sp. D14AmB TaxID=3374370 RepID=UPI00376EE73F